MNRFQDTVIKTNESKTKVEQKQSRNIRKGIIEDFASQFDNVVQEDSKTYVVLECKNMNVTVELNAVIKSLDFTV